GGEHSGPTGGNLAACGDGSGCRVRPLRAAPGLLGAPPARREQEPHHHRRLPKCARIFDTWLPDQGVDDPDQVTRAHVETYLVEQADRGLKPSSVATTYRYLQQLMRWLVDEDEIAESPMAKMRPPAIPAAPPPVITNDHLEKLLAV